MLISGFVLDNTDLAIGLKHFQDQDKRNRQLMALQHSSESIRSTVAFMLHHQPFGIREKQQVKKISTGGSWVSSRNTDCFSFLTSYLQASRLFMQLSIPFPSREISTGPEFIFIFSSIFLYFIYYILWTEQFCK